MAALTSKKWLLVVGYVREIGALLKQKYVIPLSIIEICYKHYLQETKHFVVNTNIKNSVNGWIHGRRIIEIDLEHKKSKIIGDNSSILVKFCYYSAFCYIPQISSLNVPILNKKHNDIQYYGIFGCDTMTADDIASGSGSTHQLYLFPSDNCKNNKILSLGGSNNFQVIKYNSGMAYNSDMIDCIYCDQHGIIVSDKNGLHQLKLENINSKNDNKFILLNNNWQSNGFVSLCHIGNNKLFGVECKNLIDIDGIQQAKCGIYDFMTNKWKYIASYEYKAFKTSYFNLKCSMYFDRVNSLIYLFSNLGKLSVYNIITNQWMCLFETNDTNDKDYSRSKRILWIDIMSHTLYLASSIRNDDGLYSTMKLRSYNLGSNNTKWNECFKEFQELINDQLLDFSHATLFLMLDHHSLKHLYYSF
eukprot:274620_1